MQRRSVLSLSCLLPLSGLSLGSAAPGNGPVALYELPAARSLAGIGKGRYLLVSPGTCAFEGEGIYLYPAWGDPHPYRVRRAGSVLQFMDPGSGELQWRERGVLETALFAGRVIDLGERLSGFDARAFPRVAPRPISELSWS